jgi:electron transfer flavoprotein alpha subunit
MTTTNRPIIVIAEHFQGKTRPVTFELMRLAEAIREFKPAEIRVIILGETIDEAARQIARTTGRNVIAISNSAFRHYNGELYKRALQHLLNQQRPAYVCVANSSQGSDFAPGLAVRLQAACITGIDRVASQDDHIIFSRAVFGGKVSCAVRSFTETTVLTLQPGFFSSKPFQGAKSGKVDFRKIMTADPKSRTISVKSAPAGDLDLAQANVLISAGRGISESANLSLIRCLAELFPNAAVCGSRPVIDMGWMPYNRQVGVTGVTVAPDLYIACGISGAAQHLAGMQGSGFIVAINTDPGAAIFNTSDVCIVEDLKTFIPLLTSLIEDEKSSANNH